MLMSALDLLVQHFLQISVFNRYQNHVLSLPWQQWGLSEGSPTYNRDDLGENGWTGSSYLVSFVAKKVEKNI